MGAVLVTGGAGYIGSHTVRALREAGLEAVVLDNLAAGHREAVPDVPLVQADIAETGTVRDVVRRYGVTAVIHFAALASVEESGRAPARYYQNNVTNTLALLEALVEASVDRFVFSSSAAVYGEPRETPIPETHPTGPINAYGETKLAVERALPYFAGAYGLRAVSLRYFNAAGADPAGKIGEDHDPELHLIPRALAAVAAGAPVDVFGDDYPTPDGTCVRDYVHVCDLADAHLLALRSLEQGTASPAYNLGTGRGYSVREVAAAASRVTGRPARLRIAARRAGDPAILCASSALARRELGWTPRFDAIDTIVGTAWNWHRTHPDGYRSQA